MKKTLLAFAIALTAASSFAQTAASDYFQVGVGTSRQSIDCSGATACDKSGTAVKAIFGDRMASNWAVEYSLTSFGKADASGTVSGFPVSASATGMGVGVGAAYFHEIAPRFEGVVRGGVAYNRGTLKGVAAGMSVKDTDSNFAPYVGIGLAYKLTPVVALGLDLDATRLKYAGEKTTATTATAFVRYSF